MLVIPFMDTIRQNKYSLHLCIFSNMKKIDLEIVVFFCGAVVMAYEIIGSRMLGPFVGTSMVVWSSIIGIILLSLSIGYFYGGKIADRFPSFKTLSLIIGCASLFILFSLLFKNPLLQFLSSSINSTAIVSIVSSLILFTIPAIALGMVSPFAARLKIRDERTAGATVGHLYAISTLGSITGTFLAGFYLIPAFRLSIILILLAMVLLILALYLYFMRRNSTALSTKEILSDEEN